MQSYQHAPFRFFLTFTSVLELGCAEARRRIRALILPPATSLSGASADTLAAPCRSAHTASPSFPHPLTKLSRPKPPLKSITHRVRRNRERVPPDEEKKPVHGSAAGTFRTGELCFVKPSGTAGAASTRARSFRQNQIGEGHWRQWSSESRDCWAKELTMNEASLCTPRILTSDVAIGSQKVSTCLRAVKMKLAKGLPRVARRP